MSLITEVSRFIKVGTFRLNGEATRYYYDLKQMISYPEILKLMGDNIYENYIRDKNYTRLATVSSDTIPLCTYISTQYNIPMIIIRVEPSMYNPCKCLDGEYDKTDNVLIIDDILATGNTLQTALNCTQGFFKSTAILVIVDRQEKAITFPYQSIFTRTEFIKYRLQDIMKRKKTKLCFAADNPDIVKNFDIIEKIGKYVAIVKIHYEIWADRDHDLKETLKQLSIAHDFLIMQDSKFIDVPHIVEQQYAAYRGWVDLVTVHASVSENVIRKLSGCVLVANIPNNEWNVTERARKLAAQYPRNVVGFITQQQIEEDGFLSMSTGIARTNCIRDDQKYVSADQVNTDIIIVGRGIYEAEDPVESAQHFAELISLREINSES